MFEALTTQLDATLDQLMLRVEKNASNLVEPVLLVHPPNRRNAHTSFLQARQNAIESLLTSLVALEKKTASIRVKIYSQQRACRLAQAPVSALPNELLCSIFAFAVVRSDHHGIHNHINPISTATAISKVCRKWRLAATSLRALWTDMCLSKRSLPHIDQVLRRSVVEPISLHITEGTETPISDYLSGELHRRLRTLTIRSFRAATTFQSLAKLKRGHQELLALESLELFEYNSSGGARTYSTMILPKLRTLRLRGSSLFFQLRVKHLSSLELSHQNHYSFGDGFFACLKNNPHLRTVVLDSIHSCIRPRIPFTPVTLEDLRSLEIRYGSRETFVNILRCFTAPHLETLVTMDPDIDDSGSSSDDGDSDDEEPLGEDAISLREKLRRALGQLFANSDSLSEITITAHPEVSRDLLLALKRRMPVDSVPFAECRAPTLKALHVELPEYSEFKLSVLNALLEMLALTLTRRAEFGSHLDRLVVSECLMTKAYWEGYMPQEIARKAEPEPCFCESHSLVDSSDDDEADGDTDGDLD